MKKHQRIEIRVDELSDTLDPFARLDAYAEALTPAALRLRKNTPNDEIITLVVNGEEKLIRADVLYTALRLAIKPERN